MDKDLETVLEVLEHDIKEALKEEYSIVFVEKK